MVAASAHRRRPMRRSLRWVSLALLVAAVPANASTFLHVSRGELTARAEAVVVGTVLEVESFWSDDGRVILTEAKVLVEDRKSTRLNSSHGYISYAVFCLKKKKKKK